MIKKITLISLLLFAFSVSAQVNDAKPIQATQSIEIEEVEEVEVSQDIDGLTKAALAYAFTGQAKMDTIVRYYPRVMPMIRFGAVNVATDGQFANSDFGYMRSTSFEWGLMSRVPLNKTKNLLGIKYGVSFSYNALHATNNRVFEKEGNQTNLQPYDRELRKGNTFFRNTYINIPISLDFDFSTKEYNHANRNFVWKQRINFGIGGYVAYNINSKQFISYKDENGHKVTQKQQGNWNVNDFNYGLMAYVGTRSLKVYAKYDLAPVFKHNVSDQKYWTLGLQLELGK